MATSKLKSSSLKKAPKQSCWWRSPTRRQEVRVLEIATTWVRPHVHSKSLRRNLESRPTWERRFSTSDGKIKPHVEVENEIQEGPAKKRMTTHWFPHSGLQEHGSRRRRPNRHFAGQTKTAACNIQRPTAVKVWTVGCLPASFVTNSEGSVRSCCCITIQIFSGRPCYSISNKLWSTLTLNFTKS